ncbi:MAG: hypothetical protein AB7G93_05710 [Bdellovibrionales bacterium]
MPTKTPRSELRLWHKLLIYVGSGGLLISGGAWWLLESFYKPESGFGRHPAQAWLLALHGLLSPLFIFTLGVVFVVHIQRRWSGHQRKISGPALLAASLLLALTGTFLYYTGNEALREFLASSHLSLGFAFPALFALHLLLEK